MRSARRARLVALVLAVGLGPAFATAGDGAAQTAAPPPAGPSLTIVGATLDQVGGDLLFGLGFSRLIPVAQLQPDRGRSVCILLSPDQPSRRRVCVSRRGRRLKATLVAIDVAGAPRGRRRSLRRARVAVNGGFLALRVPAQEVRVSLGETVRWRAVISWKDGNACGLVADPLACAQSLPPTCTLALSTRARRRPPFARRGRLRLLATGDSMIQVIDGYLKRRLDGRPRTSVRSDAHISTGISKPAGLNWVAKARSQAREIKPDVTVMFLGANDGFPIAGARCCVEAWVAQYARRVQSMMRSYQRGGRSYVYWLTLPTPRRGDYARVYRAVNRAIKRAAARAGDGVRVIDLVRVFTPGGHFRQNITFHGKRLNARQDDGIHLSAAGASVAATIIVDRLKADRLLPRGGR